jgi:hypothetical protein
MRTVTPALSANGLDAQLSASTRVVRRSPTRLTVQKTWDAASHGTTPRALPSASADLMAMQSGDEAA